MISRLESERRLDIQWCVLGAAGQREVEARASAEDFLIHAEKADIDLMSFEDGFFQNRETDNIKSFEQSGKLSCFIAVPPPIAF
jgi:hypothetical protein